MSAYKFKCEVQDQQLDLYYEDEAIAIDMGPTDDNRTWGSLPELDRPGFEVIIPVENAENLVKVLQDMITEIRARQTRAA